MSNLRSLIGAYFVIFELIWVTSKGLILIDSFLINHQITLTVVKSPNKREMPPNLTNESFRDLLPSQGEKKHIPVTAVDIWIKVDKKEAIYFFKKSALARPFPVPA